MNGYFLVADILGFSNIISNLSKEKSIERMNNWISLVEKLTKEYSLDNNFQLISDTLFVGIEDSKPNAAKKLINFSKKLLENAIEISLPLRGAISYGNFEWGNKLTYGTAVINAHKLEATQNWIGISCESKLHNVHELWGYDSLLRYPTPLKTGPVFTRPVIDWDIPDLNLFGKLAVSDGLFKDGDTIPNEFVEKLNNTIIFSLYKNLHKKYEFNPSVFYGNSTLDLIYNNIKDSVRSQK